MQEHRNAMLHTAIVAGLGGLRGIIVDSSTKSPLLNASILAEGLNLHSPFSPRIGATFGDFYRPLAPGEYTVHASAEGYLSKSLPVVIPDQDDIGAYVSIELVLDATPADGSSLHQDVVDPKELAIPEERRQSVEESVARAQPLETPPVALESSPVADAEQVNVLQVQDADRVHVQDLQGKSVADEGHEVTRSVNDISSSDQDQSAPSTLRDVSTEPAERAVLKYDVGQSARSRVTQVSFAGYYHAFLCAVLTGLIVLGTRSMYRRRARKSIYFGLPT